jgi:hypothetical protein
MTKMIKSARGQLIDWDLLNVQASVANNVAPPVALVNPVEQAARKRMRANMEAAKKLVAAKQQDAKLVEQREAEEKARVAGELLQSLSVNIDETISVTEQPTNQTTGKKSK